MALKMIPVRCPSCGAVAQISSDRKTAFCEYCGTQLIVNNENEFTFNYANTADVIRAQTEQAKVLDEINEKNQTATNRNKLIEILAIAGTALFATGFIARVINMRSLESLSGPGFILLAIALYFFVKQNKLVEDSPQVQYQQTQQAYSHSRYVPSGKPRQKWISFILCLLFGVFGAHKFYEGKVGMGVLYIFTFGLFGIGWIVDLIKILMKPDIYYV